MKMKKRVIGVLAAALVLTLVTTSALAAEWGRGAGARNTVSTTTTAIAAADSGVQTSPYYGRGGCHYLDVDGDGAYDYCVGAINPYLDADGDGVYDSRLTAADPYVDTDGVPKHQIFCTFLRQDAEPRPLVEAQGRIFLLDGEGCPLVSILPE